MVDVHEDTVDQGVKLVETVKEAAAGIDLPATPTSAEVD